MTTAIPDLIFELLDADIPVSLQLEVVGHRAHIMYIVDGFYKSGTIKIRELMSTEVEADTLGGPLYRTYARYDERIDISSLEELTRINAAWWQRSRDRADGWKQPSEKWIPLLERFGFIKAESQTVYQPVSGRFLPR